MCANAQINADERKRYKRSRIYIVNATHLVENNSCLSLARNGHWQLINIRDDVLKH